MATAMVDEFFTPPTSPDVKPTPETSAQLGPLSLGDAPKYHPHSDYPKLGFQGALNGDQELALCTLRSRVRDAKRWHDLGKYVRRPAEDEDGLLLRFLRARRFDVSKTYELLIADLDWREEYQILDLAQRSADEVLGCDKALMDHFMPSWHGGNDRQGRPVYWTKQGGFVVEEVLKYTTPERLMSYHVWEMEQMGRRMAEQSASLGVCVPQAFSVVDLKHWTPRLMTRSAMSYVTRSVVQDSEHYVERNGGAILINVPYVFSACWAIISALLDGATKAKIQIISSEKYWKPALLEVMEADQIPEEYGGTNPVTLRDVTVPAPVPEGLTLLRPLQAEAQ